MGFVGAPANMTFALRYAGILATVLMQQPCQAHLGPLQGLVKLQSGGLPRLRHDIARPIRSYA